MLQQNISKSLGISSTGSLTWHYRGGCNTSGSNGEIAAWWAVSASVQSITITFSGSGTVGAVMGAFCVIGADTTSPFDPNVSAPGYNSATSSTAASASITTTNQNDLVIGVIGITNNKAITPAYSEIDNTGTTNNQSGSDEAFQASTAGAKSPTFSIAQTTSWVEIADVFVPASQTVTITSSPQAGTGFITVNSVAKTAPYTGSWTPGTVLTLSATGTVSGGTGKQYVFSSWSDGGAQTHSYTVQSASDIVTANYLTQYQVTFTQAGLDSSATGTVLTVNGTSVQYSGLPYSIWVNSGDRLVYSYAATVSSSTTGKQFAVGTTSPASPLVGISSAQTVTGNYQTQYQVSFSVSPSGSGSIDKTSGFYNAGSTVLEATANSGYSFDHWSSTGSISFGNSALASTTMVINGAGTITANFALNTYSTELTIAADKDPVNKGEDTVSITGVLTSQTNPLSGKTVAISYFDGSQWVQIGSVQTASDGSYQIDWPVPLTLPNGQYAIKADFAGDTVYLASTSTVSGNNLTLQVLPENIIGGVIPLVVCFAALLIFVQWKKRSHKNHK